MPLPVEKSQGSVSSLISRFQNAADANERRKAQEGQPRPVGRLSVGGTGVGPAAKKVVEGVKGVLSSATHETVSAPIEAVEAFERIPAVEGAEGSAPSKAIEEHNGTAPTTFEPATDGTPSASPVAAEELSSLPMAPQSLAPTQEVKDADRPNHAGPLKAEASLTKSPITLSPSITPSNQSKLPTSALKSPLKPLIVSPKSLTPQRTGSLRPRLSDGADPLKAQPTGSSPSPLKPQLTGTPTRPTAASLARAKDAQERRAATEAKLASQPRKSVTPSRAGIPIPAPTSRERKTSTSSSTAASTSSIPRPVRKASATPSPASTPTSDKKKALTPSSSLMRGTASSRLKAASASASPSPTPTQPKTMSPASRTGTAAKVKPAGVTASKGAQRATPEPQIIGRIGLAGAPSNRAKASGEA